MKKLLEKTDLLAGIFGVLAIIAIACEVIFAGFAKESIAGGIKDISGTVVDVLVLIVAASAFLHKPVNFKDKFNEAMNSVKEKYTPLLAEDKKEGIIRYNIASNVDALFSQEGKDYKRIFELSESNPEEISFYINKSFFNQRGGEDFDASVIAKDIQTRLSLAFKDYKISIKPNKDNYIVIVKFGGVVKSIEDINSLIELIDYTLLLMVARNKV